MIKYNAFDLLDDKEEDINIDFEQPKSEEVEIKEETWNDKPNREKKQIGMIEFEEKSVQSIEELNQSKDKNPDRDVFI